MNLPASKRLVKSDMPTPSCHKSFTRSPRRPRKQKISPAWGSRPSPSCTVSASVFMPRRMSVTPPAQRDAPGKNFICCLRSWACIIQVMLFHEFFKFLGLFLAAVVFRQIQDRLVILFAGRSKDTFFQLQIAKKRLFFFFKLPG